MKFVKLLLYGDPGAGKTAWLRYLKSKQAPGPYEPTVGAEIVPIYFEEGNAVFNVIDMSGRDEYLDMNEIYFKDADAAIVMFDLSHKASYLYLWRRTDYILLNCPDIPVLVVGTKADVATYSTRHLEISTATGYKVDAPFRGILYRLR